MSEKETIAFERKSNHGKRGKGRITKSIKEAIEKAFHNVERKGWLENLAHNEPAVFAGLVKAIIPAEINANLQHNHTLQVNIGEAMAIAERKLAQLEDKGALDISLSDGKSYQVTEKIEQSIKPDIIDVTPTGTTTTRTIKRKRKD